MYWSGRGATGRAFINGGDLVWRGATGWAFINGKWTMENCFKNYPCGLTPIITFPSQGRNVGLNYLVTLATTALYREVAVVRELCERYECW